MKTITYMGKTYEVRYVLWNGSRCKLCDLSGYCDDLNNGRVSGYYPCNDLDNDDYLKEIKEVEK